MPRCQTCAWLVLALGSTSVTLAQTATQRVETTPHHKIVPLTSMSLDGRVSGDPDKAGAQYVIRIPNDADQIVLPHWHPEDENIVVVKGTWYLGTGDKFDRSALREMNVGDYALVPKRMHHFGWSKTETIIQVHGIGPFQVIPVDEWDFLGGGRLPSGDPIVQDFQTAPHFRYKISDRVKSKVGEGLIVSGLHSTENNITQYDIQTDDGRRFYALEEGLTAIPVSQDVRASSLTGTWEGFMRGLPGGDARCTLYLRQETEKITGVLALPVGGAAFNSSTFQNNALEIHMNTPVGKFLFNGEYKEGALSGTWSADNGLKGTWDGKKIATDNR
jgi:hypothetical protein